MRRLLVASIVTSLLAIGLAGPAVANPNRAPAPGPDPIAQVALDNGFTQLVAALAYVDAEEGTDLVELFSTRSGQHTVFAPTDAAFADLYETLGVGGVTEIDSGLVLDVLLYHVAEGRRAANSVVPRVGERSVATLLGPSLQVTTTPSIRTLAGQDVGFLATDVSASNGVIHVIDEVLLPLG